MAQKCTKISAMLTQSSLLKLLIQKKGDNEVKTSENDINWPITRYIMMENLFAYLDR